MYAAYQLINFPSDYFSDFIEEGAQTEETTSREVRSSLDTFLTPTGSVDAGKMMDEWFPNIKANVFISHSRADKNLALGLSGLLSQIGLTPFVDSCVWHHAKDLLWEIDSKCCPIDGTDSFWYKKRNITTSHVHMMLGTALTKMMDHCECIFFLNTANSISPRTTQDVVAGDEKVTHSPWLFHEISMLKLLRKRDLAAHRPGLKNFSEGKIASASLPRFDYPVDIESLFAIDQEKFSTWLGQLESLAECSGSLHFTQILDSLYGIE